MHTKFSFGSTHGLNLCAWYITVFSSTWFVSDIFQHSSSQRMKEDAVAVRPKGTTLERAIRDLEKIVAACKSGCCIYNT